MDDTHRSIFTQLDRIEGSVDRIETTIHGNGQLGLKTVVAQHSQTLTVFKRILWGIAGALGTVGTTFAIAKIIGG